MAAEMTPRPEIEVTNERELDSVVEQRKLHLEYCYLMTSSLVFDAVFEAWRRVHVIRMGTPSQYLNHAEYLKAIEDPYPYEPDYIFYCLGK